LCYILQCVFEPHPAAHGFSWNKSIVDNARLHVGSRYVFNVDLKDFFPSIDQARIWKCLQLKPFNLSREASMDSQYINWGDFKTEFLKTNESLSFIKGKGRMYLKTPFGTIYAENDFYKKEEKYIVLKGKTGRQVDGKSVPESIHMVHQLPSTSRIEIANIIASLCCTEMEVERQNEAGEWEVVKKNVLPQGAPTSPVITNIICQRLDFLLSGVAKRFGLKYSRYADDITFSSMHNVYQNDSNFVIELNRIITEQRFNIKESKTRLQKEGYRQEVTGLLVNEKVNVQKRYIKQLRMWLYYWENYGYQRAYSIFLKQYKDDKGHVKKSRPSMEYVIRGKLDFLKMVRGENNQSYLKLRKRFNDISPTYKTYNRNEYLNFILDKILENGLDNAMDNYF
jgi:hypothetical protein